MKRSIVVMTVLALAAVAAACSDTSSTAEAGGISVTDAWARSAMADAGAAYFTVTNDGSEADTLVGAAAPDVSGDVQLHETTMSGGQAEMQPVDGIEIPAGGEVKLEPGGYHVMLLNLTGSLEVGSTIQLTLTFERAGEIQVEAEVRSFMESSGSTGSSGSM